jgi:hypothetical protein
MRRVTLFVVALVPALLLWPLPSAGAGAPTLSVGDRSLTEGTGGPTTVKVPVRLSEPTSTKVRVSFTTVDGTAVAPDDYVASSGTLSFPPGVRVRRVPIEVVGDDLDESSESFRIRISRPTGASLADRVGSVVVEDDDCDDDQYEDNDALAAPWPLGPLLTGVPLGITGGSCPGDPDFFAVSTSEESNLPEDFCLIVDLHATTAGPDLDLTVQETSTEEALVLEPLSGEVDDQVVATWNDVSGSDDSAAFVIGVVGASAGERGYELTSTSYEGSLPGECTGD